MRAHHSNGNITDEQFTEPFVRQLLIHSFDTARSNIKTNEDESGEREKRREESKDKSKKIQRRKDVSKSSKIVGFVPTYIFCSLISIALFQPT